MAPSNIDYRHVSEFQYREKDVCGRIMENQVYREVKRDLGFGKNRKQSSVMPHEWKAREAVVSARFLS